MSQHESIVCHANKSSESEQFCVFAFFTDTINQFFGFDHVFVVLYLFLLGFHIFEPINPVNQLAQTCERLRSFRDSPWLLLSFKEFDDLQNVSSKQVIFWGESQFIDAIYSIKTFSKKGGGFKYPKK